MPNATRDRAELVAAVGFPKRVDQTVLCTHLHVDHVGCSCDTLP
jgi:glyoxylase-like metal-dependent hydrolase (beta-lactamase superfamily II)